MLDNKIVLNMDPREVASNIIMYMTKEEFSFLFEAIGEDILQPMSDTEEQNICLWGHILEQINQSERQDLKIPEIKGMEISAKQESDFYNDCAKHIIEEVKSGHFDEFCGIPSGFYAANDCLLTNSESLYRAGVEYFSKSNEDYQPDKNPQADILIRTITHTSKQKV